MSKRTWMYVLLSKHDLKQGDVADSMEVETSRNYLTQIMNGNRGLTYEREQAFKKAVGVLRKNRKR